MRRALVLARFVRNKERSERRDRNNDNRCSCFGLTLKHEPCGVYLAVTIISASELDDDCDHGEDTKTENGPEGELAAHVDVNVPEQSDWDGDDCTILADGIGPRARQSRE